MTRLFSIAALALTLGAPLTGCQPAESASDPAPPEAPPPQIDVAAEQAAIVAMTADYTAAVQAADADAVSALYADDAIAHPPSEPSVTGREALDAYFARVHAEPSDMTFASSDVVIAEAGDLAYEVGTWEGGKYLSVYRRTPDGWRIVADAWSDDAPPAASD